jgi:hypothetical protein
MNSIEKLAASSYLIKKSEIAVTEGQRLPGRFAYRPFNSNDSLYGGLLAAALGGLGGAAYGKLKDYMESEEEELDPKSDDYGFKMLERMQGKSRKKPSSVGASALTGALALGLPVGLAPALFGDNPVGRNLLSFANDAYMQKANLPQKLKDVQRFIYENSPHGIKQKPLKDLTLNF